MLKIWQIWAKQQKISFKLGCAASPSIDFLCRMQVYVDQIHHDVHAITRHNPDKRKTVVLVAHSAFHNPTEDLQPTMERQKIHMHNIPPLTIPGELTELYSEQKTTVNKENAVNCCTTTFLESNFCI